MKKIIIAGAGASGLTAAIAAARAGASVTVLEAEELTGSGKCNLTHHCADTEELKEHYHSRSSKELLKELTGNIFRSFSYEDTISFFRNLGLPVIDHEGYIYPRSLKSQSVLQVLLNEAEKLGVKFKYNTKVTGLSFSSDGVWHVHVPGWEYICDCVILASGSQAGLAKKPAETYRACRDLNIRVNEPLSTLAAISCRETWVRDCAGDRTYARVYIRYDGSEESEISEYGQVQWVESGVSGIVIFNLSRYASQWLSEGKSVRLRIDLLDEYTQEKAGEQLEQLGKNKKKRKEGNGAGGDGTEDAARLAARAMKNMNLTVRCVRELAGAQAAAGGVDLTELDLKTLEVKKWPGLFVCGELADVDGECGGYNLQWAWSSGTAAGKAAAGGVKIDSNFSAETASGSYAGRA